MLFKVLHYLGKGLHYSHVFGLKVVRCRGFWLKVVRCRLWVFFGCVLKVVGVLGLFYIFNLVNGFNCSLNRG